ncbi:hypothetical protein [Thermoactinomyces mirandus]|uniref:Transcription factor, RsfA family n=1 Tax=Thermoactinomyces mirandus TaxID=2756294 RepID=A0A7W1XQL1_9BACL|nr:hypothetical protein [Thermoactinomyces mirandus]MBA4601482.1 hypothetical protein [Thermoactinomyces mirandus]
MKGRRWTAEEDRILKEHVLKAIRQGGTQIEAFKKVGQTLDRTPGSCGFRWNAVLRQQDPASYFEAKKKRVSNQLRKNRREQLSSISAIIPYIKQLEQEEKQLKENVEQLKKKRKKQFEYYETLKEENRQLHDDRNSYQWYQQEVKNRYQHLLNLLSDMGDSTFSSALQTEKHVSIRTEAEHKKEPSS